MPKLSHKQQHILLLHLKFIEAKCALDKAFQSLLVECNNMKDNIDALTVEMVDEFHERFKTQLLTLSDHYDKENALLFSKPIQQLSKDDLVLSQIFLGKGAFGEVYKGLGPGSQIAIKTCTDKKNTGKFKAEGQLGETINQWGSDNILKTKLIDADSQSSIPPLIISELMTGGSLKEQSYSNKIPSDIDKLIILEKILQALKTINKHAHVHRDIAARNILIGRDLDGNWQIKVSDFGEMRAFDDGHSYTVKKGVDEYHFKWTPLFARTDGRASAYSDLWSLGILMYELFEGNEPFTELTEGSRLQKLKDERSDSSAHEKLTLSKVAHDEVKQAMINDELPYLDKNRNPLLLEFQKKLFKAQGLDEDKVFDILIEQVTQFRKQMLHKSKDSQTQSMPPIFQDNSTYVALETAFTSLEGIHQLEKYLIDDIKAGNMKLRFQGNALVIEPEDLSISIMDFREHFPEDEFAISRDNDNGHFIINSLNVTSDSDFLEVLMDIVHKNTHDNESILDDDETTEDYDDSDDYDDLNDTDYTDDTDDENTLSIAQSPSPAQSHLSFLSKPRVDINALKTKFSQALEANKQFEVENISIHKGNTQLELHLSYIDLDSSDKASYKQTIAFDDTANFEPALKAITETFEQQHQKLASQRFDKS